MPIFTVEKLLEGFEEIRQEVDGSTTVALGLTYRPGVKETEASPAAAICEELSKMGAQVLGVDPLIDEAREFSAESVALEDAYEQRVDGVVVVTPHKDFDGVDWRALRGDRERLVVVDGRNAFDLSGTDDWTYTIGVGRLE